MTEPDDITLFLCGDVMTGRGIDQALPFPGDPAIFEPAMDSAVGYVRLAERTGGTIPAPVGFRYVWGDALDELAQRRPDLRIVNLETAVTRGGKPEPKGINYRMSPENFGYVAAAGIDCCVLANNHVLDWGVAGLRDTLLAVGGAGIAAAGAGADLAHAQAPAVLDAGAGRRVLVFAAACRSSGVPADWAAGARRPGVWLLPDLSARTAQDVAGRIAAQRRAGDRVVFSVHWGGNWGYDVPDSQRAFAHALIDAGAADLVHGHSSHHPKGIEVYRDRPILYGCGDFLNDYEGIGGHGGYRSDLVVMYLARLRAADGVLAGLTLVPLRIRRFRLERASAEDAAWLCGKLDTQSRPFGAGVADDGAGALALRWG